MNYSELTFNELSKDLGFTKVFWNGKLVYDDECFVPLVDLNQFYEEYGNRYVYSMKIKVVAGHHCHLRVRGEKEFKARYLVFGLYAQPEIYEQDLVAAEDVIFLDKTYPYEKSVIFNEYLKRFEYTYNKKYELHEVKVRNLTNYPWISNCSKFYVFKEIKNEKN